MNKLYLSLQEQLKKNPTTYKISLGLYRSVKNMIDVFRRMYINFYELFLPKSFYIQSSPSYILKNIYPAFSEQNDIYSKNSTRLTRDGVRLISAKLLLDLVYNLEEGDYAELGTFRGNFASIIFAHKNPNSTLYCFDTFEGFAEKDVDIELTMTNLKTKYGHFSDTSIDLVRNNIIGKTKGDSLKLIKGYFPNTFTGLEDIKWRFVHLDADLYEPMKEGVKTFWPKIVKGGVLLIHDYNGGYIGTKKAIDEFFQPLGIVPIPLPDQVGSAVVVKN